jgi:hypothetical protein
MRQFVLDIRPLSVPAMQGFDGKTVPEIVKARGSASFIQNARCQAQLLPVVREGRCAIGIGAREAIIAPQQESIRLGASPLASAQCQIVAHLLGDGVRQRHQARLVELGGFNAEDIRLRIKVLKSQPEQLTAAQATAKEQYQPKPYGLTPRWVLVRGRQ